jgi:hypothetical protein
MKTLDDLIARLTNIRKEIGKNVPIFFDSKKIWEGNCLFEIKGVSKKGWFDRNDEYYFVEDVLPNPTDKINEFVMIHSDGTNIGYGDLCVEIDN